MLWLQSEDGSIEPVPVQTGISDGSRTEIVSSRNGKIKEGAVIVTGLKTGKEQKAKKSVSLLPQPSRPRR